MTPQTLRRIGMVLLSSIKNKCPVTSKSLWVCSLKQVRKLLTERLGSLGDFINSCLYGVRTVHFSGRPTDL